MEGYSTKLDWRGGPDHGWWVELLKDHGSWFIDASGLGARHVARTKLEMTTKYERIGDIDAAAQKAAKLKSRLIGFLIGPKSEWPEK